MAAEDGRRNSPLDKKLFDEPYRFEFFQAVRLLERIYRDRHPVGREGTPATEVARFRTRASLGFPASQIHELAGDDSSKPPQMMVAFMGLTGPMGVLPHPYTELLIERARYKDTALWEFLDAFNHRMISLFYRAWEKYRFAIAYERGEEDQFTRSLLALIGLGTRGLTERMSFSDQALLFYSGLFAQRPHSATAIEAILGDYFRVPARVEQFAGQWLDLDEESLTRLGKANSSLGVNTVAGARVWDSQSKFRLKLGPLTYFQFTEMLPAGTAFRPAAEMTRLVAGMELDFDVQLIMKAEEVPPSVLTTRAKRRPRLGWTSWLKTRPFEEDDSQVILSVSVCDEAQVREEKPPARVEREEIRELAAVH
jgi:type VI secretion system protein ImpH